MNSIDPGIGLIADRLRALLSYDEGTGLFTWRKCPAGTTKQNRRAGASDGRGYWRIKVDGRQYHAHRLAWLYVYGEWPVHQIDHINGIRDDNRIANLRDVSHSVNQQNRKAPQRTSKVGLMGAHKVRNSYTASIKVGGRTTYLGCFKTAEEAHQAYVSAKRVMHEGNTL